MLQTFFDLDICNLLILPSYYLFEAKKKKKKFLPLEKFSGSLIPTVSVRVNKLSPLTR